MDEKSQLDRHVSLRVLENQNVAIDYNDGRSRQFNISIDSAISKRLVEKFVLTQIGDQPLYDFFKIGHRHSIGLQLEEIQSRFCRPFQMFREVLDFIDQENLIVSECFDPMDTGLSFLCGEFGFSRNSRAMPLSRWKTRCTRLAFYAAATFLWMIVTLWALASVWLRNAKIGLYSYDEVWSDRHIDRRLKDVHGALRDLKVQYIEMFGTFGADSIKNLLRRRRPGLYYPPFSGALVRPVLTSKLDVKGLTRLETRLFQIMFTFLSTSQAAARYQLPILRKIYRRSGLKKVLSIDDAWTTTPLVISCLDLDLPLLALQHGQYTPYHLGMLQSPIPKSATLSFPRVLVWGNESARVLSQCGHAYRPDQTLIGGYIRKLPAIKKQTRSAPGSKPFAILYGFEFLSDVKQINAFLNAFLKQGYEIYFKLRWDTPTENQLAGLPVHKIKIVEDINQETLDRIDVCVGSSSSFMHELYAMGVPLWYLQTSVDFFESMAIEGFAALIRLSDAESPDFNPYERLIPASRAQEIYAPVDFRGMLGL